jgi:DNA-binding MarR family transcriptional regulator
MPEPRSSHDAVAAQIVSQIICARRARTGLFRPELFSDPAWDMLLVLFLAKAREQLMTVLELAEATATPVSTTVRWVDLLKRDGLVERDPDPAAARNDGAELSVRGTAAIYQWLEDCKLTSFFTLQHSEDELGGGCDFQN